MLIIISDESSSTGQTGRSQEQVTHHFHKIAKRKMSDLVEEVEARPFLLIF